MVLACAGVVEGVTDFVIVSPPDLRAAWEVYAARRRAARPDLGIAVTGTDAIYAAHPFGPGRPCRNAAESLHAYIREAAHEGTTCFLLGGMWLDAREGHTNELYFATGEKLSLSNCVPGICAYPYAGKNGVEAPSDMFYACLDDVANGIDHPWDPSDDGVYLSTQEIASCDCVPDVVVGRFAAVPYAYGGSAAQSPGDLVLAYADKVRTPTLFIHSDEDYRTPLPEGLQMYSALRYHDIPARIVIFKGENHELSRSGRPQNRIRRLQEITHWFDKYLAQ